MPSWELPASRMTASRILCGRRSALPAVEAGEGADSVRSVVGLLTKSGEGSVSEALPPCQCGQNAFSLVEIRTRRSTRRDRGATRTGSAFHICCRKTDPRRPFSLSLMGRACQSRKVISREWLLSSSKMRACASTHSLSSTFRLASSFKDRERLSRLAEPTDAQQSSTSKYLQ